MFFYILLHILDINIPAIIWKIHKPFTIFFKNRSEFFCSKKFDGKKCRVLNLKVPTFLKFMFLLSRKYCGIFHRFFVNTYPPSVNKITCVEKSTIFAIWSPTSPHFRGAFGLRRIDPTADCSLTGAHFLSGGESNVAFLSRQRAMKLLIPLPLTAYDQSNLPASDETPTKEKNPVNLTQPEPGCRTVDFSV